MEVLRSGRNDEGWFHDVTCNGLKADGCGAILRITKKDLYQVLAKDIPVPSEGFFKGMFFGEQWRARFTCCLCRIESDFDYAENFESLPIKEEYKSVAVSAP